MNQIKEFIKISVITFFKGIKFYVMLCHDMDSFHFRKFENMSLNTSFDLFLKENDNVYVKN